MINFNIPPYTGNEEPYVIQAMRSPKISGDGSFGKQCQQWFETHLPCHKALLTPSCTAALEISAMLAGIAPGDEVIMPSYTFVSTANAFALRGANIVFVDVQQETMNIDAERVREAMTDKTKAIVVVHYAGVACDMDRIMAVAREQGVLVIEDAAQGMMGEYKGRALGTIGHLGTYSFHETKNYTSGGEGGLLIINDARFVEKAEVIREKGTNRSQFFRGQVDKYTWVDTGSSYLPGELQAAYLWGQLEKADEINQQRLGAWSCYWEKLQPLAEKHAFSLPMIPADCRHNGHMFYLKVANLEERQRLIGYLKDCGVMAVFHYVPLHSSPAGRKAGRFAGADRHTTRESERLLRLPLWYGIGEADIDVVAEAIERFFIAEA
ncbi:dTDP-4-amino-4,6-dideoxygalactose transaminase [Vreelandella jeotgali]|uniref:dTDP-4-amino-4,6-dideoxygalactose transaminase n=1 Tax=Vreelandella jeotgali TaxID=553386 RepID=UPI00034A6021|nr:dTDP-4-amino-4,6-dideoxygalactose transaminase [Halomonas jeotgali]